MTPMLLMPMNSFSQFTLREALDLKKSSKVYQKIAFGGGIYLASLRSNTYEANLDTIANTLDRINTSVIHYCSSTPLYKKILHLFTGRYFKMRLLRRSLPSLICAVNHEAITLFKIVGSDLQAQDKSLAAAVKAQYPASSPFLQTYNKIKVYNNPFASASDPIPQQIISVPGQMTEENKWNVLTQVQALFLAEHPENQGWDRTAKMVNEYILGKLAALGQNGDVSLPRFYHATQEASWSKIVTSKKIIQTAAPMGHGAYVSTRDERSTRYGCKTFALTQEAVYQHAAHFFYGGINTLWVRVEHDIDISQQTVAHFITEEADVCQQAGGDDQQAAGHVHLYG